MEISFPLCSSVCLSLCTALYPSVCLCLDLSVILSFLVCMYVPAFCVYVWLSLSIYFLILEVRFSFTFTKTKNLQDSHLVLCLVVTTFLSSLIYRRKKEKAGYN